MRMAWTLKCKIKEACECPGWIVGMPFARDEPRPWNFQSDDGAAAKAHHEPLVTTKSRHQPRHTRRPNLHSTPPTHTETDSQHTQHSPVVLFGCLIASPTRQEQRTAHTHTPAQWRRWARSSSTSSTGCRIWSSTRLEMTPSICLRLYVRPSRKSECGERRADFTRLCTIHQQKR
jgi:hypothetical protein